MVLFERLTKEIKQMYYSVVLFIMLYIAGCEYSRFHSLLAAGNVSRKRRLRSQKFHTDDVDLPGIWSKSAKRSQRQ